MTLDKTLQTKLERLAADVVAGRGERLQVAIVVADHASGEMLASVGSAAFQADRRAGFVDMTRAIRSPGSTLKPLVYGLAFDEGLAHPETLIDDKPTDFNGYRPQNFDRQFRGTIRMREALQESLNIPVVALTDALGPAKLLAALDKAGVRYHLPGGQPGLAIALGGIGVSLEDMVQLYAAIARGGVALPLTHRITGERPEGQRVLSAASAWQVGDILAGLAPPPGAPENRLAYKTGTSYGHRDAWAIGFDGRHVIGVWMGRPDGTPVPGAFGADLAAPVLFQAFARLKRNLDPQPVRRPRRCWCQTPSCRNRCSASAPAMRRSSPTRMRPRRLPPGWGRGGNAARGPAGAGIGRHGALHLAGQWRAGGDLVGRARDDAEQPWARVCHAVGDRRDGAICTREGAAALSRIRPFPAPARCPDRRRCTW